jgi:hypothetical protein
MSNWTDWVTIETAKSKKGPFNHLGIYQIRAVTPTGEPIPINRFVGIDLLGILYIGRSGYTSNRSIANRIGEFVRQQHSGGDTYARAKQVLEREPQFSGHLLQVRTKLIFTKEEIDLAEAKALREYFSEHAELPPCNSARTNVGED